MMTEKLDLYKCEVCGNYVQVILSGVGELNCCGKPMIKQNIKHDKTETGEKHAPKIEIKDGKRFVTVKSHPMLNEHYIQFIEVYKKDKSELYLKYFNAGDIAEADIDSFAMDIDAIENCNIHGLWGENNND